MKRIFNTVILLTIILGCFSGCLCSNTTKFDEIEIGENFLGSRDGYYKKLPNRYCLNVSLRSRTSLFRVSAKYIDVEWDSALCYDNVVLEGHFIKGFFTSHYLVLCEEQENGDILYFAFDFSNEHVQTYHEVEEICELLNIGSVPWFSLCNTNQEIQCIK